MWISTYRVDLKSDLKVVGYSYDIHATFVPVGMSWLASHYDSLQGF